MVLLVGVTLGGKACSFFLDIPERLISVSIRVFFFILVVLIQIVLLFLVILLVGLLWQRLWVGLLGLSALALGLLVLSIDLYLSLVDDPPFQVQFLLLQFALLLLEVELALGQTDLVVALQLLLLLIFLHSQVSLATLDVSKRVKTAALFLRRRSLVLGLGLLSQIPASRFDDLKLELPGVVLMKRLVFVFKDVQGALVDQEITVETWSRLQRRG